MSRSTKIKGKVVAQDSVEFSSLTAGTVPVLDSNKNIVSSSVTSTELSNVSGTTAPVQTQLNDVISSLKYEQVIYVDKSNAKAYTADGSINKPFKSLEAMYTAITDASASKKYCCIVAPGTYTEANTISVKAYIDLVALANDTVGISITGGTRLTWSNNSPGRVFFSNIAFTSGLQVTNDNPSGTSGVVLDLDNCEASSVIFNGRGGGKDFIQFRNDTRINGICTINSASTTIFDSTIIGNLTMTDVGCVFPDSFGSAITATLRSNYELNVIITNSTYDVYVDAWGNNPISTLSITSNSSYPSTFNTDPSSYPNSITLAGSPLPSVVKSSEAVSVRYDATTSANWTAPTPTDVRAALDSLAANKISNSVIGEPNGVATLDATGKIPSTQLPSYVDDVLEFANLSAFPNPGSTGIIYLALDTNLIYRWSGSVYVEISPSQVLAWGGISGTLSSQTDLQTALDGKQGSLGFTPENVTNKSTDILLGTSDTLYPSQKAVKTYVDNFVASSSPVASVNGQTGAVILDSDDLANQQAVPDYWDIADGSTIKAHLDELAARREAQNALTKEPTGFATRDTSTTSFTDSTPNRTFTIAPVGVSFDFYVKGVKFTKTASESIQIPNLAGNHFIYYNPAGVLSTTQVASSDLFKENAFLAIVYWNTDTSTHSYFAEERHGLQMDGETHSYLHTVFGAQYLSGLALQNFVVNGDGSLATHAQFTADEGSIRDEDLLLTLAAQTEIPVLFRQGSLWRKKAADSFPVIYSGTAGYTGASGRLPYNQLLSGSWQLTEIANNAFVLVHIFATNDKETPIIAIQGIAEYGNVTAARLAASTEITSLSGLPFAEFVALGSVVFESSNTYTNTPKAITRSINGGSYVDFRGTQLYTAAGVATSHNLLSGLAGDDHIQYHTDARGDIRYYTKAEVDALIGGGGSPGDISEDSYSFSNSQVIPENITGLIFAAASVRSFNALVSVSIDATSDLFETFELTGVNKSGSFSMSVSSVGDDSGVVFSITSTGQVQYTSSNYSGFVSGTIKFRAITTTV